MNYIERRIVVLFDIEYIFPKCKLHRLIKEDAIQASVAALSLYSGKRNSSTYSECFDTLHFRFKLRFLNRDFCCNSFLRAFHRKR